MSPVDVDAPIEPLTRTLAAIKASQSKAQYTCKRYVEKRGKGGKTEKGGRQRRERENREKERAREKERERKKRETERAREKRRERKVERACSVWFCVRHELETLWMATC